MRPAADPDEVVRPTRLGVERGLRPVEPELDDEVPPGQHLDERGLVHVVRALRAGPQVDGAVGLTGHVVVGIGRLVRAGRTRPTATARLPRG